MFQPWRVQLRQAREALRRGQFEEARRLLCAGEAGDLRSYQSGQELALELADGLARRATELASLGESSAGWRDLATAVELGGQRQAALSARQELVARGLAEAEKYLAAGDVAATLARLDKIRERRGDDDRVRTLLQTARHVQHAQQLARRGEFDAAQREYAAAIALRPEIKALAQQRSTCHEQQQQAAPLRTALAEALGQDDWNRVVATADDLLRLAPDEVTVRQVRDRAWGRLVKNLQPEVPPPTPRSPPSKMEVPPPTVPAPARRGRRFAWSAMLAAWNGGQAAPPTGSPAVTPSAPNPSTPAPKFVAWVDAVGGFLVCLGDEIVLGQPLTDGSADVGILGDVSRRHAIIRRDHEQYVLVPLAGVRVNGQPVVGELPLADGMVLELGSGVQIRFRRPHPLSSTARLEMASRHRFKPHVDAVILMAATCVLGPKPNSHVVCRHWDQEVILFRDGEQLYCRTPGTFEVDHVTQYDRGAIGPRSQITGEGFAIQLEEGG